jgi:hypothetical protein
MDLEFEWDEEKAKKNKQNYGISFELAKLVFNDEKRIEFFDDENSLNEDRYDVIGKVSDIVFVVYTERNNKIQIISARLATRMERRMYNDYNNNIISK